MATESTETQAPEIRICLGCNTVIGSDDYWDDDEFWSLPYCAWPDGEYACLCMDCTNEFMTDVKAVKWHKVGAGLYLHWTGQYRIRGEKAEGRKWWDWQVEENQDGGWTVLDRPMILIEGKVAVEARIRFRERVRLDG
jgi:hypothetical protein